MGKTFAAMPTFEWLLARVDPFMLLKMVLELESFEARRAFKLAQIGTVSVICHVSLQLGQVGKLFGAHSARQVGVFRMHRFGMMF